MRKKIYIVIILALIGIQFIPVKRTNPPVNGEIDAPKEIRTILRNSCYDCHSNKTEWPWYSYVAPVSFLVAKDVERGRRHVNFTEWDDYNMRERKDILKECIEEIESDNMPIYFYRFTHPSAKVNEVDLRKLKEWAGKYAVPRFN